MNATADEVLEDGRTDSTVVAPGLAAVVEDEPPAVALAVVPLGSDGCGYVARFVADLVGLEEGVGAQDGYVLVGVPGSEHCMAARLECRGNPHCSAKGWGKEPTCVQGAAHHTSMRTLATEGDTAWGN